MKYLFILITAIVSTSAMIVDIDKKSDKTFEIYLNGNHINNKDPLWIKNPNDCSEQEYLNFYEQLYPFEEKPLFWIHLNVDYPFHLKGILYFSKFNPNLEMNKNSIKKVYLLLKFP
jgi:HSP90 family molecular chaperone